MTKPLEVTCTVGIADDQMSTAARLYDAAFAQKFALAIPSREQRLALFEQTFKADFAIAAYVDGGVVGLAGFHTEKGAFTGAITARLLWSRLGFLQWLRAIAIFSLYDRKPASSSQLLMDGIAVAEGYRGQGIGGMLLRALFDYARENGYQTIRLDVIDTNPNAQRLYQRHGFIAVHSEAYPWLRGLLGFSGSTTMEFRVD